MSDDALSNLARWHAVAYYKTSAGTLDVEMYLEEIEDLHDRIERGPHWDTVQLIEIRRVNHIFSPELTLEQSADLGSRPIRELYGHILEDEDDEDEDD
ncbi:hypothetical protein KQ910_07925 [Reyranella sp. MMS21-HV4-11]|uniref:Uncharacterized protein n=1 Tax=Reyranella humidisoli TaxID=2849149 RepID=A0ABS6IHC6_9HYPH|nr:hypothetical protein [Reyranella sp. MMS21-HV4-11]MBU8873688.1 hypothetical protein [Reyranella sp. MMS21-HV4-11]